MKHFKLGTRDGEVGGSRMVIVSGAPSCFSGDACYGDQVYSLKCYTQRRGAEVLNVYLMQSYVNETW